MLVKTLLPLLAAVNAAVAQGLAPTVSQAVFNNIVTYTGFSAASYADNCGTPLNGATVLQYFSDAKTDAQATLFKYKAAKQIVIAFRGTSTPADFNTDLAFLFSNLSAAGTSCSACKVHTGFQNSWLALQTPVLAAIKSALAANRGYTLIVTGHSLGGGIAAIATSSIIASKIPVAAAYTYGEPRNGNSDFANYINGLIAPTNYYRVTHANDGVPQVIPTILGYIHHGYEIWQKPQANITASNTYNCRTYLGAAENAACNNAQNPGNDQINGAHISYSNGVIGNPLYIAACGQASKYIP